MDHIRVVLRILWRERFWVLSVVGILVAVVCWHMSSGELAKQFADRERAIGSSFKDMTDLNSKVVCPNEDVNQGDLAQLVEQRNIVLEVWKELYDRQREEVLYWPKDSLKESFIEEIEKLEFGDPFPVRVAEEMRNHYQNYIEKRFDGLLEIVKALDTGESGRGSRFEGDRGLEGVDDFAPRALRGDLEDEDQDYLVQWVDQDNLREDLHFKSKPTPMQIWVTQEDLWVYETLLNVIAKTNEQRGATRPDNTAVRVIVALEVGRDAAAASRNKASILMPSGEGSGGGEGERGYGGEEGLGREGFAGEEGYGGDRGYSESAELDDATVLSHRYLDAEGQPYEGEPQEPEFRRLPVRMRLMMDQRWLPQLLIECANASLPIEVKQLRVNPDQSGEGFGGTRGSVSREGSRGYGGTDSQESDPNLADVEIQGIVYIYNKPDESVLTIPGVDEDQLADVDAGNLQR